ncbi:MAG: secretion protein F [Ruminiclostridium sp.]|nr:secretion protein F [Ruminiclostridium sp.]
MVILLAVSGIALAVGLFFLMADVLKIPYLKTSKAVMSVGKTDKKISKTIDAVLVDASVRIGKLIPMDKYKRIRMEKTLASADIKMTPETFRAYSLLKALGVGLLIIPCAFIFPMIVPLVIILAVTVYFKEIGKADEQMRKKRAAIESELPRFVATVEQELKTSRDILSIMENYKKHAGEVFSYELDVTTADMRSSSYEAALTRFESRIGSSQLSDVVRGLVSVIRGDDSAVYFKMLAHDFKLLELQRLKNEAQKIPTKIRIFSLAMLMTFLLTYLVVMGMQLIDALGTMM